jgi:hypothetical protein
MSKLVNQNRSTHVWNFLEQAKIKSLKIATWGKGQGQIGYFHV